MTSGRSCKGMCDKVKHGYMGEAWIKGLDKQPTSGGQQLVVLLLAADAGC